MEQDQNDNSFTSLPEFFSFERRLMEVLHELNMKRRLLDECRHNLEGALWKQHELESMLDVERRDSQTMRLQLGVAVEAVQHCGEERAAATPELSRLRIELEAAVRERDCLKDQACASQLENLTLSRQVEELKGQLHCQQMFHEKSISLETKIQRAVEEVKSEIQKLDQDHKRLERTYEAAEKMGSSLQEAHGHFRNVLERTSEQQKKYETQVVALRAEVESLKMEKRAAPADFCKEMDNDPKTSKYLQEIKDFVASESKGSTKLTEALHKALQAQAAFQKLEQGARDKLQKKIEHVFMLQSSNDALNKSLCEAQETIRLLERQVQELLTKPASEERGIQTDTVKCVQTEMDTSTPDVDVSATITVKESVLPEQESELET